MNVKEVVSAKNPLLQKIRRLSDGSDRKQLGLFLIEGTKLIEEAIKKNIELIDLVASRSFFNSSHSSQFHAINNIVVVEDKVFNSLCTTDTSCKILATAKQFHYSLDLLTKQSRGAIVIGECIQDPGNLGTIIRTALAFEALGLVLTSGSVDFFNPKVVRGSMGAVFSLPIVADQDIETCLSALKSSGRQIIALDAKAMQSFDALERHDQASAFLFGNEGQGLSPQALKQADRIVSIPISQASESLNVAVAMGIVMYHVRGAGGGDSHSR